MFLIPTAVILMGVWIYLVWMVRKKKTDIFHDRMEPKLAQRQYKRLKRFLLVAGISFLVYPVSILLQVLLVLIFNQPEEEGAVVFFIAFFSVVLFILSTIGGLVLFLKGQRKTR